MTENPNPPSQARTAIYLNKRAVARIELSLGHTMAAHNDGWRIDFTEQGRIRTIMTDGHNQQIDISTGDYLLASGEDLYLSLQRGQSAFDTDKTAKDERTRVKQENRDTPAPASSDTGGSGTGSSDTGSSDAGSAGSKEGAKS